MRRKSWVAILLLLLGVMACSPALGENVPYTFSEQGVRLYLPEDWQVLTLPSLSSQSDFIAQLGTTQEALQSSYLASGTLLEAFPKEGGQLQVRCRPLPSGFTAENVSSMTSDQKQEFLTAMVREGGFASGVWREGLPAFAVFSGSTAVQAVAIHTITYATIQYGQAFLITSDIIGRDPTAQDEAILQQVAEATLFLGAQSTSVPVMAQQPLATLNQPATATPAPAAVNVQRNETPIALDNAPSTASVSFLTLTGTTEPNTSLRYYVNGTGYERFTSDENGRFSIFVRELPVSGKNIIQLQAMGENGYGSVSFTVVLEQVETPLAVTLPSGEVAGTSYTATGTTLPGAQVRLLYRNKTYEAQVNEDGSFSCPISLPKIGENAFTVRATLNGYKYHDEVLTLTRVPGVDDEQEAFLKKVKSVSYEKMLKNPDSYQDMCVKFEGIILSLANENGQPYLVLGIGNAQNPVAVKCSDLIAFEAGQQVTLLCTLAGAMQEVQINGTTISVPVATFNWQLTE